MKNICYVSGSRAEYGIMKPLLRLLDNDENINLDIIVTGSHLEKKYGNTYKIIEEDFKIFKKIKLDLRETSNKAIINSISILQIELSNIFEAKKYDAVIILGDRYEMLSVSNVAIIYNIPIIHLHGGEKTLGNYDEFIRHSITKMSHLHLVSCEEYRNRVIQMGESPKNVINIGSIGVENIIKTNFLTKEELEKYLGIKLLNKYFVVLFHPTTLKNGLSVENQVDILINALKQRDYQYIFIGSNADTDSDKIMNKIKHFINDDNHLFYSLNSLIYHSLIKHSKGLIGNSSSGIIEVPSLNVATINIGDRQKGRLAAKSVINCDINEQEILKTIDNINNIKDFTNPYVKENSSILGYNEIKKFLNTYKIEKDFYDIKGDLYEE